MDDCRITAVDVRDVHFLTSRTLAGSDGLLAARFEVPVCPRDRVIEYVDELHEHFVAPAEIHGGAWR